MRKPSKALIKQAAAVFVANGATEVYLFGSQTTKRARAHSDVDFAVVGLPPAAFFQAMGQAWDVLGRPIDLVDLDDDVPFTRHLKLHGELLRVL